jgi:uncharacterized secreted protein with C-terminal beta-propeller domain
MPQVGQVAGLGRGEQIYSVRFLGDAGYVVTFRQVDPLYTLDLSVPSAPRVVGQLELEGYSSYLHPVSPGRLLGIGQDVGSQNEPSGSKLVLFDVSDPSAPRVLARTSLGGGSYTAAQYDHHAFLFWPPTGLAVLPLQIYGTPDFTGAIGFHVSQAAITEAGRVQHDAINGWTPQIGRALVVSGRLYTISDGGVMASSLGTLTRESFAPFPQPAPGPGPCGPGTGPPPPAGANGAAIACPVMATAR